jgi:hypothetical protein
MATRTLKAKYETLDRSISRTRAILCHSKNVKEIYYQYEDEVEAPPAESTSDATSSAPAAATAAPAAPVAVAAPTGPVASIEDVPVKAIDILLVAIAQKLKKRIDEIPLSKTIKDLVGGISTLQNEILGDLQQEFASAPEKGEELLLEELGPALGSGFNGTRRNSLLNTSNCICATLVATSVLENSCSIKKRPTASLSRPNSTASPSSMATPTSRVSNHALMFSHPWLPLLMINLWHCRCTCCV